MGDFVIYVHKYIGQLDFRNKNVTMKLLFPKSSYPIYLPVE